MCVVAYVNTWSIQCYMAFVLKRLKILINFILFNKITQTKLNKNYQLLV